MARTTLSRRALLRGMLGGTAVAIGLPTLEIFLNSHGDALAQGAAFPQRFGIFFWGNGNIPDRWNPAFGTGALPVGSAISDQLTPLMALQHKISLVTGTVVKVKALEAHSSGAAGIFTGSELIDGRVRGATIDQVIADTLSVRGGRSRFRSIETSCEITDGNSKTGPSWSYTGPTGRNPSMASPFDVYNSIFGSGFRAPGEMPVTDVTVDLRLSALDAVSADAARLRQRLGTADRQRLDKHLAGIREIEQQLEAMKLAPPDYAACVRPNMPLPEYPPIDGRTQLQTINRVMADLVALALACDQTRVFSHWFTGSVSNLLYAVSSAGYHQLTHDEADNAEGFQTEVNVIVKEVMTAFAYWLEAFERVEEGVHGDGSRRSLLDNTGILATSDCSLGRQHKQDEYPIIIAGSAGGKLRMGQHIRALGDSASRVVHSLAVHAYNVDLPNNEFGFKEGLVNTGLPALEVS